MVTIFLSLSSDRGFISSYAIPDEFLKRNHQILRYEEANVRDLVSLQNWLRGNPCMTRAETAYLTYFNDLMSLNSSNDTAMTRLETWAEDCLIKFYKGFRQVSFAPVLSAFNFDSLLVCRLRSLVRPPCLHTVWLPDTKALPYVAIDLRNGLSISASSYLQFYKQCDRPTHSNISINHLVPCDTLSATQRTNNRGFIGWSNVSAPTSLFTTHRLIKYFFRYATVLTVFVSGGGSTT